MQWHCNVHTEGHVKARQFTLALWGLQCHTCKLSACSAFFPCLCLAAGLVTVAICERPDWHSRVEIFCHQWPWKALEIINLGSVCVMTWGLRKYQPNAMQLALSTHWLTLPCYILHSMFMLGLASLLHRSVEPKWPQWPEVLKYLIIFFVYWSNLHYLIHVSHFQISSVRSRLRFIRYAHKSLSFCGKKLRHKKKKKKTVDTLHM